MKIKIIKSTLGDYNNGHCGNSNNCYYKGTSPAWIVELNEHKITAFRTKKAANIVAKWLIENEDKLDFTSDGCLIGDLVSQATTQDFNDWEYIIKQEC